MFLGCRVHAGVVCSLSRASLPMSFLFLLFLPFFLSFYRLIGMIPEEATSFTNLFVGCAACFSAFLGFFLGIHGLVLLLPPSPSP